jgi:hypothetical protein
VVQLRTMIALTMLAQPACLSPAAYECTDDVSCGTSGVCEASNFCSFPDSVCMSGRRYGEHAGAASRQCVDDEPIGDESVGDELTGATSSSTHGSTTSSTSTTSLSTTGVEPGSDATTSISDETGDSTGSLGTTGFASTDTGTSGTPTNAGSTGDPVPPSCIEVYGSLVDSFEVCSEDGTKCRFAAQTARGTCSQLCDLVGGTCLHGWDEIDGMNCVIDPAAQDSCNIGLGFQICECTFPAQ